MFSCVLAPVSTLARDFDASLLSPGEARGALEELAAIRNVVDGLILKVGRRIDETGAHAGLGERSAACLVARTLGVRVGDARDALATAAKLEALPIVERAVRAGKLSGRQASMIAGAASVNPDAAERLLDAAPGGLVALKDACARARAEVEDPKERSERQKKSTSHRSWTDDDGMAAWSSRFTPEIGAQLNARVEAETQRIFRERRKGDGERASMESYAAEAVANLILGNAKTKGVDARLHLLLDYDALRRGYLMDGEICEIPGVGPVGFEWAKSLIGSAFLTAVVKNGKDITTVAHLGRYIPVELQTALVVQGHECEIKGCGLRGYLERDHIHDHAKQGPTSLDNLEWLCWHHHQLKTRGWILGPPEHKTGKRTLRPPP